MLGSITFEIRKFLLSIRDFGFIFSCKYMFHRIRFVYFKKDIDRIIKDEYSYLKKFLTPQIEKYNKTTISHNTEAASKNVWVCWWQGLDSMPEWCKICYDNLRMNIPKGYKLTLITCDNVRDYVDIPKFVYDRLNSKDLTITQFSDILREALIYYHGGLWIDASVWTIPNFYKFIDVDREFYSVKLGYIHRPEMIGQKISECMWSGFFMYGKKGCLVAKFAFECMCAYYKHHTSTIDYFIQNFIIRIGYDCVPQIKELIDSYPINNKNLYTLPDLVYNNELFNKDILINMMSNTGVFKITQKRHYLELVDGKLTYYGYLKKFGKDII